MTFVPTLNVAAAGQAAPYQLMSELYALDGEYPAALRTLAKAESLGVHNPNWNPPARRLLFLAKSSMASWTWAEAKRVVDPIGTDRWSDQLAVKYGMRDVFFCPVGGRW